MPTELSILFLGGLLVAIGAAFVELKASLEPARCSQCQHCRQLAYEAHLREERELSRLDERFWDKEPRDDEASGPRR